MLTLLDGLKRLAEVQVACDGHGSLRDPSSCGGILDTEGTSCTQTVPPGHIGHLRTQRARLDMENTPEHGGHPWTQRALPGHRGHPWKWRALLDIESTPWTERASLDTDSTPGHRGYPLDMEDTQT